MTPRPRTAPPTDGNEDETFGELVRRLRHSVGETQDEFCRRFNRSRQAVTNAEGGREVVKKFMEQLVDEFAQEQQNIEAAFDRSIAQLPQTATRRKETRSQRRVDSFISRGQFNFARRAILEALDEPLADRERHWMYERLATVAVSLKNYDEAATALTSAIDHATAVGLLDEELSSRDRLATSYLKRAAFDDAHVVLNNGLLRHPAASRLWLRKGYVHWYEQQFSSAFAALTTALEYGSTRLTVVFARGQVLAEWGNVEAALVDITEYLAAPDRKAVNIARIRGARAYCWAQMGLWSEALAEFDAVEQMKLESSWLYYNRGLSHAAAGQQDAAVEYLVRSLRCRNPLINPPRRRNAIELLQDMGVEIPETGG